MARFGGELFYVPKKTIQVEGAEGVKLCSSPSMVVALERQSDASNEIATRANASCKEVTMGVRE